MSTRARSIALLAAPVGVALWIFVWVERPLAPLGPLFGERVTFAKDVAPIVFENCVPCHHPTGPAPFGLLTYEDVRKRAHQVAAVTASRYMPPWLPKPAAVRFVGERKLTDDQIGLLQRWVEDGTLEGDTALLPPEPEIEEGWQIGEPDLVLEMPEAYVLAAEGVDVFRNFVFPVPVVGVRHVRAAELRPGNRKIVHHASILIDRKGASSRLDASDPGVGFAGMEIEIESDFFDPHSHFLFWKPGTPLVRGTDAMSWRLDPGDNLVVNVHLQPSGKPERVQPAIGLYFSPGPATQHPMLIQLENDGALDIPPGEKNFVVSDHLELPVDVDVLGIYPHAHYLGKTIKGTANLPDGTQKTLIDIQDWDFNWQAVYHFVDPVFLPRGSRIAMQFTYDNSADNVRNPNNPPKRVTAGDRSSDEMAHLWIQVLPRQEDVRLVIQEAVMRRRLQKYPSDFAAHFNLGAVLQSTDRLEEGVFHLRKAVSIRPNSPAGNNSLGAAFLAIGKLEEAVRLFRLALRFDANYANAHSNLARVLTSQGRLRDAVAHLRKVVELEPWHGAARSDLGAALVVSGAAGEGIPHLRQAVEMSPSSFQAHYNLASALLTVGETIDSERYFRMAVSLDRGDADGHAGLGSALAARGEFGEAVEHLQAAIEINPDHTLARENLDLARMRAAQEKSRQ